ncbi:hypothetical protein [Caproiciproducens faecalis]|uniref:Secreted protein n=1 Tax=Caproiciproducens faecalis TaxID=2820301 RepID=A0ABS7DN09_9FIRM|nr:hypothetical protein [Caproiciproducens faecalis]MBW7572679.1 hypothetical protein [Caproiciproducens faecalis]
MYSIARAQLLAAPFFALFLILGPEIVHSAEKCAEELFFGKLIFLQKYQFCRCKELDGKSSREQFFARISVNHMHLIGNSQFL